MTIAIALLLGTGGALIGLLLALLGAGGSILLLPLLLGGVIGAAAGQRLAPRLNDRQLRRGFSAPLIGSALLSGVEAWHRHDRASAQAAASGADSTSSGASRRPLSPAGTCSS